jgi:acyl-CoA synthetase (NDP forming)
MTTSLDIIEHLIDDVGTRVVAGYIEGFQDAHRLVEIGRRALRTGKPIVIWKVGNSEAGARAALSHTANLGGAGALYRAAFRQAGVIEANDVGDLADCVKAFSVKRLPAGNRIMVLTLSGGAGIAMADRCVEAGLALPALGQDTVVALRKMLPPYASVANPLDVTGSILNQPGMLGTTLERLAQDLNVDMIGIALAAVSGAVAVQLAKEIVRIASQVQVPVLVAWNADPATSAEAYQIMDEKVDG